MQKSYEEIYDEAEAAARAAVESEEAVMADRSARFNGCGFAWVHISGKTGFARWAKKNGHASEDYPKGRRFHCPGNHRGQDVWVHRVGASAFADSLKGNGIDGFVMERLD